MASRTATVPLEQAREDLAAFGMLVGRPLSRVQAEALQLERRTTVVVGPRQSGKSQSLALLACHHAYQAPRRRVLVVSAGEEAAKRLLGEVRSVVVGSELLAGSVVDESAALVVLSNGSEIRSVPASERQIRGWSVDLLLVDEAALVSDDVLLGAAMPTTAARPEARIVLASSPWSQAGSFYRFALAGLEPNAHVRTFTWSLSDCSWISEAAIAHARATLPPLRFAAEYEGQFVAAADSFFDAAELLAATADFAPFPAAIAHGESVIIGADWSGRSYDPHAIVALGVLDDFGVNEQPVLFLPWLEAAQRAYALQIERIVGMVGGPKERYHVAAVVTEVNGVGMAPSETLIERLGHRTRVVGVHSSQRSKEDAYGRIRGFLSQRRLVLPNDTELLRQLRGLAYEVTPGGGVSIAASNPAVHDDLADALSLAMSAVTPNLPAGRPSPEPREVEWLTTGSGIRLPKHPRPRPQALGATYGQAYSW